MSGLSERDECPMHSDEGMYVAVRTNRRLLGDPPQPCTCGDHASPHSCARCNPLECICSCHRQTVVTDEVLAAIRDEARAEVLAPIQAGAAWLRRLVRWWDHLGTVDLYDDDVWKQR